MVLILIQHDQKIRKPAKRTLYVYIPLNGFSRLCLTIIKPVQIAYLRAGAYLRGFAKCYSQGVNANPVTGNAHSLYRVKIREMRDTYFIRHI